MILDYVVHIGPPPTALASIVLFTSKPVQSCNAWYSLPIGRDQTADLFSHVCHPSGCIRGASWPSLAAALRRRQQLCPIIVFHAGRRQDAPAKPHSFGIRPHKRKLEATALSIR